MTLPKRIVKTVKGDAKATRLVNRMDELGYDLVDSSSRKVVWSPVTGLFTRKQKHTLIFVKRERSLVA